MIYALFRGRVDRSEKQTVSRCGYLRTVRLHGENGAGLHAADGPHGEAASSNGKGAGRMGGEQDVQPGGTGESSEAGQAEEAEPASGRKPSDKPCEAYI